MATTTINPAEYQPQLDEKAARIQNIFADFDTPELEVFASPAEHYRMRAEFRVWHEDLYAHVQPELARNTVWTSSSGKPPDQ